MRRLLPGALAVIGACLLATAIGRVNAAAPVDPEPPFVPGQVVVGLEPGASPQDIGIASGFTVRSAADFVTIAVPPGRERQYVETLGRQPGVLSAELNYLAQPQVIPNDERFEAQWDMPVIQAPEAWDLTRGAGAIIAIVDTGVAFENYGEFGRSPELSNTHFVSPWDFTKDDAHPNDDNGHGTHVTGTVAQDWNDGIGVAGLAPDAAIMPVKVCLATGCPGDMMAAGIRWAVDHGADVINMSLGGPTLPLVERQALGYAEQQGVVVVAAAGNGSAFVGGSSLDYPAKADTVIAVGAIDVASERTRYSNYGKHEHDGGLQIMAPGGDLNADLNGDGNPDGVLQNTYAFSCQGGPRDYTQFADCFFQGTSMATPHVAGAVALLLSRFPDLTPPQVRSILACAALDAGPPGVDDEYGVGVLQAATTIMDNNQNDVPDCLDERPQLNVTVGGGTVRPGDLITVPLDAVSSRIINSYAVQVTAPGDSLILINCNSRGGGDCIIGDQSVQFISDGDVSLSGNFRLGELTFLAAALGQSTLKVGASATLSDQYEPPVQVSVQNATVIVKEVPLTVTGDVNCDGKVTVGDVTLSLGFSLGVSPAFCWSYGDINCSGRLDGSDALALLDFLSGLGSGLPSGCPN